MKYKLIIDPDQEEQVTVVAHSHSALTDRIEELVQSSSVTDRLAGYLDDDMKMLPFAEIECITVIDGKTYAIDLKNRQYRLKLRLYELEAHLPPYFIRINKSSLANERRIERFCATFSGAVDAVFKCGYREYVSRRCFAAIKRRYEK